MIVPQDLEKLSRSIDIVSKVQELRQSVRAGNCYRDLDTLWSRPSCNSTFWKSLLVQQWGIFVTVDTTIYQIVSASVFLLQQTWENTQKRGRKLRAHFKTFSCEIIVSVFSEKGWQHRVGQFWSIPEWSRGDPQLWIPV